MAKYATVDEYISALPEPLRTVATNARRVIDENLNGAESAIRWEHPTWSFGKTPVCYLKAASQPSPSASGTALRLNVNEKLFADWLAQARQIELGDTT